MRSEGDVHRVFDLWDQGLSKKAIARETSVSRSQVRAWIEQGLDGVLTSRMRQPRQANDCDGFACGSVENVDERAYAYLLGQYLGDGCISEMPRSVYRLRISTCDEYPDIREECAAAMWSVIPRTVGRFQRLGCTDLYAYSKHWPCLFPQHGPGPKHLRPIYFEPWQLRIALDMYPDRLLRGLIHSDGCRSMNVAVGKKKRYYYPRYQFSNECKRIRDLFMQACWRVGAECRQSNRKTMSVARRESVALLDTFIGPKT